MESFYLMTECTLSAPQIIQGIEFPKFTLIKLDCGGVGTSLSVFLAKLREASVIKGHEIWIDERSGVLSN